MGLRDVAKEALEGRELCDNLKAFSFLQSCFILGSSTPFLRQCPRNCREHRPSRHVLAATPLFTAPPMVRKTSGKSCIDPLRCLRTAVQVFYIINPTHRTDNLLTNYFHYSQETRAVHCRSRRSESFAQFQSGQARKCRKGRTAHTCMLSTTCFDGRRSRPRKSFLGEALSRTVNSKPPGPSIPS